MLFGCDQIIDRSLEKLSKTKNNESILTNKENSLKSLGDSNKENSIKKPEEKTKIKEGLSEDNSKELKKSILLESLTADNVEILVNSPLPSATTFRSNSFKTRLIRFSFTSFFF